MMMPNTFNEYTFWIQHEEALDHTVGFSDSCMAMLRENRAEQLGEAGMDWVMGGHNPADASAFAYQTVRPMSSRWEWVR
jgi:hypothetical protein